MLPIDAPLAKVRRAYSYIRRFERETEAPATGKVPLVGLAKSFDSADSAYVLRVEEVREVPVADLLLLDEAAHHLRSALDHVLFAVALADSGVEQTRTQFPLHTEPNDWNNKRTQEDWLAGVCPAHREIIEKYQPYHPATFRGKPIVHPLKTLADLDNDNKHALLQGAYVTFHSFKVSPGTKSNCRIATTRILGGFSDPGIIGRPLQVDLELARVPVVITGPNQTLELEVQWRPYLAFRNGIGCANLRRAAALVRRLIGEFSGVLGDPLTVEFWSTVERRFKVETKPVIIIATIQP